VREPISPEVVSSAHNVFVDYAAMLGVGGIAWGLLLLGWLWRSGAAWGATPTSGVENDRGPPVRPLILFGPLAAALFLTQYAIQFPGLYAETALLWLVGALGFVGLSAFVILPVLERSPRAVAIGTWLSAVLLLLHAQIEMTFFWTSAAPLAWVIVALASCGEAQAGFGDALKSRPVRYLPAAALLVLGLAFAIAFAKPTARHQDHLRRASEVLRLSNNPAAALQELDAAAAVIGNDPTTSHWRVGLRQEIAAALVRYGRDTEAQRLLEEAMVVIDQAESAGIAELASSRRRGGLAQAAYETTGDRDWLRRAERAHARSVELSPNGLNDHIRLADAQWQLGDFDDAEKAYRRALEISDNYYLDPDTQLGGDERRRIELRIGGDGPEPVTAEPG
jgi:hypothetical protein